MSNSLGEAFRERLQYDGLWCVAQVQSFRQIQVSSETVWSRSLCMTVGLAQIWGFFFFFFFCNTLEDVQRHCTSARIFSSPSHLPSDTDIQPVHGKGDFCLNGLARDKQRDSSSLRKNYFS